MLSNSKALFVELNRSALTSASVPPPDSLWHYAPPAVGCAIVNYIGNEGWNLLAGIGLLAVATYTYRVLKISLPKL